MSKLISSSILLSAICTTAIAAEIEEVVTIASRTQQLLNTVPANISVIDESLGVVNHEHVQQVLNQKAGVNLQHGSGQEYLPAIRSPVLTGAGACGAFLMTENSIPLRAAGFCNINELFESHTEQAEQIEILRGPGTVLHGSNAMHGIVNVKTQPNEFTPEAFIALDNGSYDYWRARLHIESDDAALKLTSTHDGGWRADSGYDQHKLSAFKRSAFSDLTLDSGISITHLEQETAGFITGINAYQDTSISKQNFDPEAYRNVDSFRLWTAIENSEKDWQLIPYLRVTDMEFLQHFLPGKPLEENGQKSVGLMSQYSLTDTLLVGVDAEYTQGYLRQSQINPTVGSAFLKETVPQGKHYDFDVDALMLSAFVQYDSQITERLSVQAGLRFEAVQYDYDNQMIDGRTREDGTACGFGGCRYSRPADRRDTFNNLTPKFGLVFSLHENHQLYTNVSAGYRAPQANELYRLQRAQSVADLDSESLVSMEVGVRGAAVGWRYSFAAYHMQKENVIFRDSDFFNVSNGETKHRGIELELEGEIDQNLIANLSLSYAKHTYENNGLLSGIDVAGNDIDTSPELTAFASLTWTPSDTVDIKLEWQHLDQYYLEPENLFEYQGHDLLHLRSQWRIKDDLMVYFNLENITNERYADRADFTGFTGERYFPGKPVNYQLGISKSW